MLFNSTVFAQFFGAFLLLFWLARRHLQARNTLIVVASYYFYGWWNVTFLGLILASSLIDYSVGVMLGKTTDPRRRKWLLMLSVSASLTFLGFFKYYDFFVASLAQLAAGFGLHPNVHTLAIILPAGISFYTFQTMSYVIDVYRGDIQPTRNPINFLAYVSFFPQLVAGPIERARHLLPQFERTLTITLPMIQEGIWLSLWGLFKKVVVADNLAPLVEIVYDGANPTGSSVLLGTIAFAFQIYCDFSGYSDIARGTARLLGFDIMVNFDMPYSATSVRDFWRRWHISLSTWLRDYLYIGLGGNRRGPFRTYLNLIITLVLGGLWHGAAWNFVLWGFWHGLGLAVNRLCVPAAKEKAGPNLSPFLQNLKRSQDRLLRLLGWALTMAFVLYGWLLFRANSLQQAWDFTLALGNFSAPMWLHSHLINLVAFVSPVIAMEIWLAKAGADAPLKAPWAVQAALQGGLILAILLFWEKQQVPFIYFQF